MQVDPCDLHQLLASPGVAIKSATPISLDNHAVVFKEDFTEEDLKVKGYCN